MAELERNANEAIDDGITEEDRNHQGNTIAPLPGLRRGLLLKPAARVPMNVPTQILP